MKKILLKIKQKIKKEICINKYKRYKKYCKNNNQSEFLIFNAPIHGNIGDHAIIYAEYKLLEKLQIKAFEISTYEEEKYFDYIKQNISKDATISITGGGFIGSQWLQEEELVNKVIENFKEHKIIIFPATLYFKDDEQGKRELEKSIQIINNAKNIKIFAREDKTYEFAKNTYVNAEVTLVPDIVLSLDNVSYNTVRDGVLLCLRKDVEGILTQEDKENLYNAINSYDTNIKQTDTVVSYSIKAEDRNEEIEKKIKEFSCAKIVITDRLHGMIFAVITNTPCIVMGNYNYKVKGVYENWIKNKVPNVKFIENIKEIEQAIKELENLKDAKNEKNDFEELTKVLEEN